LVLLRGAGLLAAPERLGKEYSGMDNEAMEESSSSAIWKPIQSYAMAAICLVIGLVVGYLLRGSAATATPPTAMAATAQPSGDPHANMGQQNMPSLEEMKKMADKQAEPLLTKLKTDPKNVDLLNKTALTYKATHQFQDAASYFQKALDVDPRNVAIRTDMASCLYYTGDVDGALAELDKSLTYDPKHAGTLMNIGIIKWQGKNDVNGAVAAWEKLLKLNPNFPQKEAVEHLITDAKQQRNTAQSSKSPKG
jgi:cytochrome c-type biogenesis protein CcmH/NrfG